MRHGEGELVGAPGRLRAAAAAAPSTLLALLAVGVFLAWAATDAGYQPTTWYPGALFLLALLVLGVVGLGIRVSELPLPVRIAGAALLAFTFWSFLSIAWADAPGDAWTGANRTLLYLIAFALFAAWSQRGETATALLAVWALGIAVLAVVELLRVADASDAMSFFVGGRLAEPAGYPNANAALWLMALWPALALAARPVVPWWLRGLCAGAAVVLADVALLSQSRGSILATGVTLAVAFAIGPARVRLLAVLVPVGIAVALTTAQILDVESRLYDDPSKAHQVVADVALPILVAAAAVALVWGAVALLERLRPPAESLARDAHRVGAIAGVAVVVLALVVAVVAAGDPFGRLDRAWSSFKRGGSSPISATESRLGQVGSNRYDFWRVSLDVASAHPLVGIGADNFAAAYLKDRRSNETPRFPHSVEMSVLSGTGIVGLLLLALAVVAALVAALGGVLRGSPLARTAAAGATLAFVYWLAHGSVDWLWEFPGLGAPAFALLGLAGALAPRGPAPAPFGLPPLVLWIGGGAVTLAAAGSLLFPWLAARDVDAASTEWTKNPQRALAKLDQAADLDPLSVRPDLVAGSIALRLGATERARKAFEAALERDPTNAYAALELGAIASTQGHPAQARVLLRRAAALDPRDPLTRAALARVQRGGRVDVAALNRAILTRAQRLLS